MISAMGVSCDSIAQWEMGNGKWEMGNGINKLLALTKSSKLKIKAHEQLPCATNIPCQIQSVLAQSWCC